jgi:hypothetical protein
MTGGAAGRLFFKAATFSATLMALMTVSSAWADGPVSRTSSLSWIRLAGADGCVSTQDLARDVELRLGRPVFVSPSRADVSVEGHVQPLRGSTGWRATIVLRDVQGALLGTRELSRKDASCDAMREPVALVIAVMIDPDAALSPAPAPPVASTAEAPPPPAPIVIEKEVKVEVRVPERRPDPFRLDVGAAAIASVGLLPHVGIGAFGGGLLEPPGFVPLEGYGAVFANNEARGGGGGTFSLAYVGGGVCPLRYHSSRLHVYGCLAGQLGYLLLEDAGQHEVYVAGAAEGRGTLRLVGPVAARLGLSFLVPIVRERFPSATGTLFQMSPVGGTADLGLGVVFP